MKQLARLAAAIALGGSVACGQSPQEKQAEEARKQAEEVQNQAEKSADQMSKGADELAKGFEELAKGMGAAMGTADGKAVEPVDFRALQALLPDVAGWQKGETEAEKMTMPVSFAYASSRYNKADSEVSLKITDSGLNQMLIAPITMMMAAGYQKESTNGFEKSTTVAGQPAFEKWNKSTKRGELTLFVNKRFVVELEGEGIADNKDLYAFVDRTDLKRLSSLQ